ncbi:ATP-dependent RecD-like DNA helicase [Lactobacillus psittaci]|uniref:ATP-dependent RecD2 DNA helicase n=1 Tax=Lactobacillus psittaci DSM 15354 TaxID=1122152 RepID=A0A0R1S3H7_9LACO|nr:ATP-dependent RecD-like DNA helicase [Lactobacillus psittaci]KRL63489.1 exodeoxyribonuclease V alpha subunit [Lactobacillus psittaci DSM 15354]
MVEFTGRLSGIIFENNEDMFKILDVEIVGELAGYDQEDIRVTGNFGDVTINSEYQFSGELIVHKKFGQQFRAESYHQVMPHEEGSLTKYLSGDKFPGIGRKTAQAIIDKLGLNALQVLKEKPNKIAELGLTQKQKDSLLSGLNTMDSYAEINLKLSQYGLRKNVVNRIYHLFHGDSIEKLEKDPYALINEISGYGFKQADYIGEQVGIDFNDARRINGAIYQVLLNRLQEQGDTFAELKALLTEVSELTNINQFDAIADAVNDLQRAGKVVVSDDVISLQNIFETEQVIAQNLSRLNQTECETFADDEINDMISECEKHLKISYDDTQKTAIKNALNHPLSLLTGGPGTGKTTIINGILYCLRRLEDIPAASLYSEDPPFILAAPTGRAAKRMSETTGVEAKTIHRLLGLGINNNNNEDDVELNELNGEILIIDEMSMVDMFLFKQLLSSIVGTKRVVFVGDKDQLPSVGPGNIFGDMITVAAFPITKLTTIHRQGDDSSIITLAHSINEDQNTNLLFQKTKNYSFIPCPPDQVGRAIEQIVNYAVKKGFDQDDIQVLSAMYHGTGGINNLNNLLQKILNPKEQGSKFVESHDEKFMIGDRVLQLQNNPEKDIYNGQIGKVIGINEDKSDELLVCNFDDREVKFSRKDLLDLTRAYAITIHKSQGSEFPLVILVLTMQNYVMLRRNLLYTAVTRAAKNLVLVGEQRAFLMATNTPGNNRKTGLASKIIKLMPNTPANNDQIENKLASHDNSEKILTKEAIYSGQIDPMIGMEGIKLAKLS